MACLGDKELFLLDMDGTIYLDRDLFPWTIPFLEAVKRNGCQYRFLTNNSSKSGEDYIRKLAGMGIEAVREEFVTSVDALIADLLSRPFYKLCYVFGTRSFRGQLQAAGIPVTDRREDGVDCLVIGFDTELTFQKLEDACILLNKGVDFIAANPDWVCPTWYGSVPDCGSVCEMLYRATGRRPRVIGKPQPSMARLAMERAGVPPDKTVMVGDRLYTDIAAGANAGVDTAFVLSGEGTRADLEAGPVKPTWVFASLAALHEAWEGERAGAVPSTTREKSV
ncbi:MAG: HAD-IIA family hydrolase [Oscillospiraceae bacterium]|nr:HAD-IIA family hydrolase [Oscillospiraceae bacterium]